MNCDNCRETEVAYTLQTHVDGDERIDLHFCSTDCLRVWT